MKTTGASTGKAEPSSSASFEHCCVVVNYDLPWNPMRVEQRIGRCDRLGQASDKIHIRSLASEGTIESRILGRLYERLGIFERALGELEVVLGEAMANFERDLFKGGLTEQQQIERLEQTAQAIENTERHRESVTQSSVISTQGRHLIDSDQQEISDAETGFLSPDDLADFVYAALERHLPNTLRRTATAGQFRLVNGADLEDALKRLQRSYPAASNARTQIVRFRDRARRRATANVSFTGEHSEAEFVHARHPLLLLARHLGGPSTSETPWCVGVVPSEMTPSPVALVWAVGTHQGYASRSELFCGRVDLETSEVASVPVERAQQMARAMSTPPDWSERPEADIELIKASAEQTLLVQFKSRSEFLASRDRLLADRAKRAVRSHAQRQKRRNDDHLAKPGLDARLRTLYSGWNRRIEQETETKLEEIERRSGVRSSLEVIGMALSIPNLPPL